MTWQFNVITIIHVRNEKRGEKTGILHTNMTAIVPVTFLTMKHRILTYGYSFSRLYNESFAIYLIVRCFI